MKLALVFILILSSFISLFASEIDVELADSLKIEANHNRLRLQSFKSEATSNKIFDDEREKGLGEFLEEQEKWDLLRERGLQEYRTTKRSSSPREGGVEYNEYLEQKESQEAIYERSRKIHVNTRDQIATEFKQNISSVEAQELGLNQDRPRYELRKRSSNKWAKGGRPSGGSSGAFNPAPAINDFPPTPELPTAPAPYEGYDDIPAPAPPPVYDSNGISMPYDPSADGGLSIPPPPPPPPDFDF